MPFIAILNVCCSPNPLQERSFLPKRAAIKKNSRRRRPLLLAHAFYYYPKCLRLSKSASGKELLLGAHGCPRCFSFTALLNVLPLSYAFCRSPSPLGSEFPLRGLRLISSKSIYRPFTALLYVLLISHAFYCYPKCLLLSQSASGKEFPPKASGD